MISPTMKFGALLLFSAAVVYAFTPEEVEIFQMQNEITKKHGNKMNFYKFLKLPKLEDSTSKEIIKNLRKLSKKYHPDRNRKYRKLYEELNIITNILSDDSRRKTYDYYLKNGFPDYSFSKGGFFFKRVQPKTSVLIVFIFVVVSIIHYILLKLQNASNKKRIKSFVRQCKENDDTSGLGEKRLTFKQHEGAEPKEILVSFGDVYVMEPNGKKSLISTAEISDPTVFDSLLFKVPLSLWKFTIGKLYSKVDLNEEEEKENERQLQERGEIDEEEEAILATQKKTKKIKKKNIPSHFGEKVVLPSGNVVYSRKKH